MSDPTQNPVQVPIRIDAMWSDGTTAMSPPATRYDALGDTISNMKPWLGDTCNVAPNDAVSLPTGLHLHWTLPKALRAGSTVFALDTKLFNELVRQGVPVALVQALQDYANAHGTTYSQSGLQQALQDIVGGQAPTRDTGDFDLSDVSTTYHNLVSSDQNISVTTYQPDLIWDPVFLEIYGPTIISHASRTVFHPVPNRWLVLRTTPNGQSTAWVVESDRLTAPSAVNTGTGPVAVPAAMTSSEGVQGISTPDQAYAFLGAQQTAMQWTETTANRFATLTAIGNGQADFAMFYPNCQGVFGFHDTSADQDTAYTYTVLGWFNAATNDPLSSSFDVQPWANLTDVAARAADMSWILPDADWTIQDGSVYTAQIAVTGTSCHVASDTQMSSVDIAIGNTQSEAFSAFIAAGQTAPVVGLTPEAILNAAQTGILNKINGVDGPAVIENTLHSTSFSTSHADWIWRVVALAPDGAGLSDTTPSAAVVTDDVAKAVNALNAAQAKFDAAQAQMTSQRRLLFADWCRAAHLGTDVGAGAPVFPNAGTQSNFAQNPQIGIIGARFVEASADALDMAAYAADDVGSMPPYIALQSLYAAQIAAADSLSAMQGGDAYRLLRTPGQTFFRPNDPTIMMVESDGGELETYPASTLPNVTEAGVSGLKLSQITPATVAPDYLPAGWDQITGAPNAAIIGGAVAQQVPVQCAQSWRPLSLLWRARFHRYDGAGDITPAAVDTPPFTATDYKTDFVTSNFALDPAGIDYAMPATPPQTDRIASYLGRIP